MRTLFSAVVPMLYEWDHGVQVLWFLWLKNYLKGEDTVMLNDVTQAYDTVVTKSLEDPSDFKYF